MQSGYILLLNENAAGCRLRRQAPACKKISKSKTENYNKEAKKCPKKLRHHRP